MSNKKSKFKLTLTKTSSPAPLYKQVTLPHILPWCSSPETTSKMSQSLMRSGGSGSGAPRRASVTKTPTNLHVIVRHKSGDETHTFDFGSQGHVRINQFLPKLAQTSSLTRILISPPFCSLQSLRIWTELQTRALRSTR